MRYTKEHKQKTRARIVATAARLFRRHGYDGVGIETLMDACGLTRGGFYGHFRSKAALYEATLEGEQDFVVRMRARSSSDQAGLAAEALDVARDYLAPAHRAGVIRGCTLASLAAETARASKGAQRRYARIVRDLSNEFSRGLDGSANSLDERALAVIATCVGGLLLSAACAADGELSEAISDAAADAVARRLGDAG